MERVKGTAKGKLLIRLLSCNDVNNPLRRTESSRSSARSSLPTLLPRGPHWQHIPITAERNMGFRRVSGEVRGSGSCT